MSIRSLITTFLSNPEIQCLDDGKKALIPFRSIIIKDYTLQQSRSLWYALLLYKFKSEQNVPDNLWSLSREFILMMLREEDTSEISNRYFILFDEWKEKDYHSFIQEITGFYFQLLEIKDSIETIKDEDTLAIWRPLYSSLINKVRQSAQKMGFLQSLDDNIVELKKIKERIVYGVMHKAYWDMFEEDIQKDYTLLLCNLHELKQLLLDIVPVSEQDHVHQIMNMEKITSIVQSSFNIEESWDMCSIIIDFLQKNDSVSNETSYDHAIQELKSIQDNFPHFLRRMMEMNMVLATQLKTKKGLWMSLFRHMQEE